MMSNTRLYVEPTEALMGQARKKRLLILLKQQQENMKGLHFILYHSNIKVQEASIQKGRKQAFQEAETGSEGHLLALYVIIEFSHPHNYKCTIHSTPPPPLSP